MNDGFTIQGMLKEIKEEAPAPAPNKSRCGSCKKKLMLSHIACSKCSVRYCDGHRLPELHDCPHDFKKEGQTLLEKQNPRVVSDKLERC